MDWFIVMKRSLSFQYTYADSSTLGLGFGVSPFSLASNRTGAVAWTINAAMNASFVFLNDHSPMGGTCASLWWDGLVPVRACSLGTPAPPALVVVHGSKRSDSL